MQILHAGRYSYQPFSVSASSIKAPINPFRPRKLTGRGVRWQIRNYVRCARLAKSAGYDGVEIMGGEGYFINQFLCERTNRRTDQWGGSSENRRRMAVEIVRRTRKAVGPNFIIVFRLSMADLVEGGQTWDEIVSLAKEVEAAGARSSTPTSGGTSHGCPPSSPRFPEQPSSTSPANSRSTSTFR